jgi:hypothetical protein
MKDGRRFQLLPTKDENHREVKSVTVKELMSDKKDNKECNALVSKTV